MKEPITGPHHRGADEDAGSVPADAAAAPEAQPRAASAEAEEALLRHEAGSEL